MALTSAAGMKSSVLCVGGWVVSRLLGRGLLFLRGTFGGVSEVKINVLPWVGVWRAWPSKVSLFLTLAPLDSFFLRPGISAIQMGDLGVGGGGGP